jgi:hypothetical protein
MRQNKPSNQSYRRTTADWEGATNQVLAGFRNGLRVDLEVDVEKKEDARFPEGDTLMMTRSAFEPQHYQLTQAISTPNERKTHSRL